MRNRNTTQQQITRGLVTIGCITALATGPILPLDKYPGDATARYSDAKEAFRSALGDYVEADADAKGASGKTGVPSQEKPDEAKKSRVDEASDETFPSSDPPSQSEGGNGSGAPDNWHDHPAGDPSGRPSNGSS